MDEFWITDELFRVRLVVTTGAHGEKEHWDCYTERCPDGLHIHLDDPDDLGGLVHECVHVAHKALEGANVLPEEEIVAYYAAWWYRQITAALRKAEGSDAVHR